MEENKVVEGKKKSSIGLKILVVILLIISICSCAFIVVNKDKLMSSDCNNKTVETKDTASKDSASKVECPVVSYDLKTDEYGLVAIGVGLSVSVDKSRKSVRISSNAYEISTAFGLGWVTGTEKGVYSPIDTKTFDKKISQVLVDGSGQSVIGSAILYLMEDGTVEYVPILKDIETNWSQQDNTKKFNSYGTLEGITDVISLVPAEGNGYHTVLAKKVDGTVTNLSSALGATGNFR